MGRVEEFLAGLPKRTPNDEVGKEYCRLFIEGDEFLPYLEAAGQGNNNNISVLCESDSLEFITKRIALISDLGILSHNSSAEQRILGSEHHAPGAYTVMGDYEEVDNYYYVDCPSFEDLGGWIKACKELIVNNSLIYLPRIKRVETSRAGRIYDKSYEMEWRTDHPALLDVVVRDRRLVKINTKNVVKNRYLRPIVEINLPIVDNSDLAVFARVTANEKSSLDLLRLFL